MQATATPILCKWKKVQNTVGQWMNDGWHAILGLFR